MALGIDDAIAAALGILTKFIPDPAQKMEAETALRTALLAADAPQAEVNKAEAQSARLFVAGWRPFIGWVCGAALAWQYVAAPLALWAAALLNYPIIPPPRLDDVLWQLMFAMLGMGGLRTYEKIAGVAKH